MTADVVLRDGSTLHLREARAEDSAGLADFRARIAPADWLLDFADLAQPDEEHEVVLVGEIAGNIDALAGFRRVSDSPDRADIALVVAPMLEGRGIGMRLLEILADAARARGIGAFDAWMPAGESRLLDLFLASGFGVEERRRDGKHVVSLAIAETPHFLERNAARAQEAATASMKAFFEPASVAVVGANQERGRIGSEVLHNLRANGFQGPIYPVHPAGGTIDGLTAYRTIGDIPGPVDLAVVIVPAAAVLAVVDEGIAKGVKAFVVISAGFSEIGGEGRVRESTLVDHVRRAGVRLIGPNCMGILNTDPAVNLDATFAPVYPPAGRVAMSTQSGALGLAILDYAQRLNIGISTFVSVGNKADVSGNDLIQYWADDPRTDVILLYVESFGNPRKFSEIARRVGRTKPIVAVKSGRSRAGARAASSHTGALASPDAMVDALFRQAGVIRTDTLEQLFDVAALLAHQPVPQGRRVGILTNAGGPGILAADACEAQGLQVPTLSDATIATLRSFLPAAASVGNPVDMIASASAEHYGRSLTALLADEHIDSVLVIFIPPLVTQIDDVARAIREAARLAGGKPVIGIFMSAQGAPKALEPIPCYMFPESAATALARATGYGEWRRQPVGEIPVFGDIDAGRVRGILDTALTRGDGWLTPGEAQLLLSSAGIHVAKSEAASTEDDAVRAADRMGYPVVLKAIGPAIVHKTEVGGVRVNLKDAVAVRSAFADFATRLGELKITMTGVLVQEMVKGGVEMLVGATEDPVFGPAIVCGSGGILAELLADAQFRLSPLSDRDARAMVDGMRGVARLRGYRGSKPADEGALVDALLRLSALITLCPEIVELDINPLTVLTQGAKALDARVRVERATAKATSKRVVY